MTEYRQRCPECLQMPRGSHAKCWLCNGTSYLRGNGSAQTNPTKTRVALAYEPTGRTWDNIVRASEEIA